VLRQVRWPMNQGVLEWIGSPFGKCVAMSVIFASTSMGARASIGAHEAGASREIAEHTNKPTAALVVNAATEFLNECGVEPLTKDAKASFWPHPPRP
jgi:hypothetical protein